MVKVVLVLLSMLFFSFTPQECPAQGARAKGAPKAGTGEHRNKLFYLKDRNVWLTDAAGKAHRKITTTNDVDNFGVSIDGSKLALVRKAQLHFLDLTTGVDSLLTAVETDESPPSISPDNDKIVYVGFSQKDFIKRLAADPKRAKKRVRHLWLYDVKAKTNVDLTEDSSQSHSAPKWSPDGRRLSYAAFTGFWNKDWRVFVRDMASGTSKEVSSGFYTDWVDDKIILLCELKGLFCWFDIEALDRTDGFTARTGREYTVLTYSPTARRICFEATADEKRKNIDCYDETTSKVETVVRNAAKPMFSR